MRCRRFRSLVEELLTDSLPVGIAEEARSHARDCGACRRHLEAQTAVHEALRSHWRGSAPPAGMLQAVKARVGEPPRPRSVWVPAPAMGVLAAAAVALVLLLPGFLRQPDARGPSVSSQPPEVRAADGSKAPPAPVRRPGGTHVARADGIPPEVVRGDSGRNRPTAHSSPSAPMPRLGRRLGEPRAVVRTPHRTTLRAARWLPTRRQNTRSAAGPRHPARALEPRGGAEARPSPTFSEPVQEPAIYTVAMLPHDQLRPHDVAVGQRIENSIVQVEDPESGRLSTLASSRVLDTNNQVNEIRLSYSTSQVILAPAGKEPQDEDRQSHNGMGHGRSPRAADDPWAA